MTYDTFLLLHRVLLCSPLIEVHCTAAAVPTKPAACPVSTRIYLDLVAEVAHSITLVGRPLAVHTYLLWSNENVYLFLFQVQHPRDMSTCLIEDTRYIFVCEQNQRGFRLVIRDAIYFRHLSNLNLFYGWCIISVRSLPPAS